VVFSLEYIDNGDLKVSTQGDEVIAIQTVKIGDKEYEICAFYDVPMLDKDSINRSLTRNIDTVVQYIEIFRKKYSENVQFDLSDNSLTTRVFVKGENFKPKKLIDFDFSRFFPATKLKIYSVENVEDEINYESRVQVYVQKMVQDIKKTDESQLRLLDESLGKFQPLKRVGKTALAKPIVNGKINVGKHTHVLQTPSDDDGIFMSFFFLCAAAFSQDKVAAESFGNAVIEAYSNQFLKEICKNKFLEEKLETGISFISELYYTPTEKLLQKILVQPGSVSAISFVLLQMVLTQSKDEAEFFDLFENESFKKIEVLEDMLSIKCKHYSENEKSSGSPSDRSEEVKGVSILKTNNRYYTIYDYDQFKLG